MPRNPLQYILNQYVNATVSIERNTQTKDASGGNVNSWATLSGASAVKACKWPKRHGGAEAPFGGRDEVSEWSWVVGADYSIRAGDRINESSVYYDIIQVQPFSHQNLWGDAMFELKTILVRN